MRYFLLGLCLLLPFLSFAQEDIEYKEYSYTQLFKMIEAEEDSIFRLRNAIISYDPATDSTFVINLERDDFEPNLNIPLVVNKELIFQNIFFKSTFTSRGLYGLTNITFQKSVRFDATKNLMVSNCTFNNEFIVNNFTNFSPVYEKFEEIDALRVLFLTKNQFNNGVDINSYSNEKELNYYITNNQFYQGKSGRLSFLLNGRSTIEIGENQFFGELLSIEIINSTGLSISENEFNSDVSELDFDTNLSPDLRFTSNTFKGDLFLSTKSLSSETSTIDWEQFGADFYDGNSFNIWRRSIEKSENHPLKDSVIIRMLNSTYREYFKKEIIAESEVFKIEVNNLGKFYRYYKERHDTEYANAVYIRLKNLETERYAYLYNENRNFKAFFTWKINQFLKIFSAYGTEPARAIIFSMYVILAFALIYLFFPNHWDSHGKNRIVDRFSFFLKYMKRDAGMHDVYLEEKQGDILAYDEYKQLLESSGKDVPKFFQATGLPLYKWAISGTKLTAGFLSRVDVMKGTWSELPQSKRVWKSVLLISAFLIALLYDILIKMLNALMLSINTFTTLGFGEIPIKGLPRYLAIIQGFIGWFMLTIFSVSLISQLLN